MQEESNNGNLTSVDLEKIDRLEVINHAKNRFPIGRALVLHKEMGDFDGIEFSIQDNGGTLKIFILNKKK